MSRRQGKTKLLSADDDPLRSLGHPGYTRASRYRSEKVILSSEIAECDSDGAQTDDLVAD